MNKTMRAATLIGATLLAVACKDETHLQGGRDTLDHSAAPQVQNRTQVEQEIDYLKKHFPGSPCMDRFESALSASPPSESFVKSAYTVNFSGSDLIEHPIGHVLMVRRSDHLAYLLKGGGLTDGSAFYGPMKISECLSLPPTLH